MIAPVLYTVCLRAEDPQSTFSGLEVACGKQRPRG
jgi:hypothetical protein